MSEMHGRIAAIIQHGISSGDSSWDQIADEVIRAMRNPTVEMVNRARSDKPYDQDCEISWQLMIDEALK